MSIAMETSVLSEALQKKVGGRRVRAALFTTFQFDPGFFETEVLPVLFERSYSPERELRRVQLEEDLRQIEHIAVYYDRTGLIAAEPPVLDVRRVAVSRVNGVFHPKVILLLVEDRPDPKAERRPGTALIVGVLSANLTKSGWWDNVECGEFVEFADGGTCSLRTDLLEFCGQLRKAAPVGEEHHVLAEIRRFVVRLVGPAQRSSGGKLYPRLFVGKQPFAEFLKTVVRPRAGAYALEIISPYFDAYSTGSTVKTLVDALQPSKTRILLPRAEDGTATCTRAYFDAVREIAGVSWGRLDASLLHRSSVGDGAPQRFVHAKVYRLFSTSERKEYLVIGSANLTQAAHAAGTANREASIIIEVPARRGMTFWMEEVKQAPSTFAEKALDEQPQEPCAPPVALRFDWNTEQAEYFWSGKTAPGRLTVSAGNVEKGTIENVIVGDWTDVGQQLSTALKELLTATPFVTVDAHDGRSGIILIDELEMAQKPSLLLSLTPEQILKYWSLLSAEQRQVFLEQRREEIIARQLGIQGKLSPLAPVDSMFDRFAGIFHAFERLDEHVRRALKNGQAREAEYRLFGRKYDSLQALLDKTLEPPVDANGRSTRSDDPVTRYVTLLTAKQLLKRIQKRRVEGKAAAMKRWNDFLDAHQTEWRRLSQSLDKLAVVRSELSLSGDGDEEFLEWFESMFLKEMKRSEVSA